MVDSLKMITFDESLMAYQPSSKVKQKANEMEPIPVVFIPRKPHPNGLLLYQAVTYIQHPINPAKKIPYLFDTLPYLKIGDARSIQNLQKIKERLVSKKKKLNYILDGWIIYQNLTLLLMLPLGLLM